MSSSILTSILDISPNKQNLIWKSNMKILHLIRSCYQIFKTLRGGCMSLHLHMRWCLTWVQRGSLSEQWISFIPDVQIPFRVLRKIGPNAYELDISKHLRIDKIFNVEDLTLYHQPMGYQDHIPYMTVLTATLRVPRPSHMSLKIDDIFDSEVVSIKKRR